MSTESNKPGFAITIGGTEMTLDIGKEDLLAVAVANYEQSLLAKRKSLVESIRATQARVDASLKEMDELRLEIAKAIDAKKAEAFIRAAKRVGMKLTFTDRVDPRSDNKVAAIREFLLDRGDVGYRSGPVVIHHTVTVVDETDEIKALGESIKADEDKLKELGEDLRETINSLRNMSTKEREARAHLVVKGLQSTEEGRALLSALTTDGNPFMLTDGEQA